MVGPGSRRQLPGSSGAIRSSFRFLHGSLDKIDAVFDDWDSAVLATIPEEVEDFSKANKKLRDRIRLADPDAKLPSKYALWATQSGKRINFTATHPQMAKKLAVFKERAPDVVILTEGWGGWPVCEAFAQTIEKFELYPEVHFVWAPIYVTNRQPKRFECFKKQLHDFAMARKLKLPTPDKLELASVNWKIIDFWDLASHLAGDTSTHIPIGGNYMNEGLSRFFAAAQSLGAKLVV